MKEMYDLDKEQFGKFLANLRKEKGFTQKELAEKLFVSDKTISKWECGNGMPDISVLVPLSELLNISVTELLSCRKYTENEVLDSAQVDAVVKKAIQITENGHKKRFIRHKKRIIVFLIAIALSILEIELGFLLKCNMTDYAMGGLTFTILAFVFGIWFTFFASASLPSYYDEYKIDYFSDGILRLNLPGVHFNNTNWPHMVKAVWIWCVVTLVSSPVLSYLCSGLLPNGGILFLAIGLPVYLISLFAPFYVVSVKYKSN